MTRRIRIIPADPDSPTTGPTLFSYLGYQVLNSVSREGLAGNIYVPLSGLLYVCGYLYETGAILGRAEPDRLNELISMSFSGDAQYCLAEVKRLLRRRLEASGRYAHSFYIFYLHGIMEGMNMSFDVSGMKEAHKDIRHRTEAGNFMEYAGAEGLLLGSRYPDLAEKMYGYRHGPHEDVIHEMTKGLDIMPEAETIISIREREQLILDKVREFVSQYHPDTGNNSEVDNSGVCSIRDKIGIEQRQPVEAYLDIETTGLSPTDCYITVIGIYICRNGTSDVIQLVGRHITKESIMEALQGVNTLYTYNGSRFDLPFIYRCLGINLAATYTHIDLMYHCWRNNLRGGLKSVERQLGINRNLKDVNGYEAVRLWWRYLNSDDTDALDKLLKYNTEDVINLKFLKERLL